MHRASRGLFLLAIATSHTAACKRVEATSSLQEMPKYEGIQRGANGQQVWVPPSNASSWWVDKVDRKVSKDVPVLGNPVVKKISDCIGLLCQTAGIPNPLDGSNNEAKHQILRARAVDANGQPVTFSSDLDAKGNQIPAQEVFLGVVYPDAEKETGLTPQQLESREFHDPENAAEAVDGRVVSNEQFSKAMNKHLEFDQSNDFDVFHREGKENCQDRCDTIFEETLRTREPTSEQPPVPSTEPGDTAAEAEFESEL